MDHFILHGNIIPTKELDNLSTRMNKVGNVIYDTIDGQFGAAETLDGAERWLGCRIIFVAGGGIARIDQAIAEYIGAGVGRHGSEE